MGRHTYLKKTGASEAWERLKAAVHFPLPRETERVATTDALGRIAAAPVIARYSSPAFPCAAMDGVAVRARDTEGITEASPRQLAYGNAGVVVDTGDAIPSGFDAVVMIEEVHDVAPGLFELPRPVAPWQHVRMAGEDIIEGDVVVPRGRRIGPFEIGALLAVGRTEVDVVRRPIVGILPTGDELMAPGTMPTPGAVIEFNSHMIAAMVTTWGGLPRRFDPAPDTESALAATFTAMLDACDIVVVNAGSSAGRSDLTPSMIARFGTLLVHGVDLMPGKPTALGVAQGKPLIGLPGYPVSTVVAAEAFLRPTIAHFLATVFDERPQLRARLTRPVPSRPGLEEIVRVRVGEVGGQLVATPLPRGAGAITTLTRADALLRIPPMTEGLNEGDDVDLIRLRPEPEIRGHLVAIGSHDLTFDIIDDLLRANSPLGGLSSSHVGSVGGLLAIAKGEAHLAGTHLIDPETGTYNLPSIRRYAATESVLVVELVQRTQGLYVARGNPKRIETLRDLARPDVMFVNRQRGAGTRVLLDLRLRECGVAPDSVRGYQREELTHLAVAMAVRAGVADTGLGIQAVAALLDIDFVPLEEERFDIVIPTRYTGDHRMARLLDLIASQAFRTRVAAAYAGYDATGAGRVIA